MLSGIPVFVAVTLETFIKNASQTIMLVSGLLAAVMIIAGGFAMGAGNRAAAKWALAGAVVMGLAFLFVKVVWTQGGAAAYDLGTFTDG